MIVSMIDFIDGLQEVLMSILLTIFSIEDKSKGGWALTQQQVEVMGAVYFLGVMIGNVLCAQITDRFGRRKLLTFAQLMTTTLLIVTAFIPDGSVGVMIFVRTIYGVIFGLNLPISQVVVSEIMPTKIRGRLIVLLQFIYIIGILYLIICCIIFLDSPSNWRTLILFNSFPSFLCFLGSIFVLKETPRYLLQKGRYEEAFAIINYAQERNNQNQKEELNETEKGQLTQWQIGFNSQQKQKENKFVGLFNQENRRVTCSLWTIFVLYNIIYVGTFILIPFLLRSSDDSFDFGPMMLAYGAEIPAILIVMLLIDSKRFGGRIRITIVGLSLLFLFSLLMAIWRRAVVIVSLTMMRFSFRMVWSCLNALPAESYSTRFRATGVGSAQGIGKLSGTIAPFIIFPLYFQDNFSPFILGCVLFVMTAVVTYFHPVDLTKKPLDNYQSVQKQEQI